DMCEQSTPQAGLCFSEQYFKFIKELKDFSYSKIYNHWRLLEFKSYAQLVLSTIYRLLMNTQNFARNGRIPQSMKYYESLSRTFEDWLIRYTNYVPQDAPDRKKIMRYQTPVVFDVNDYTSYQKCVIEYISGMTDSYAIKCYEEIISF
ncbi:MAG TPA: metal-dependent phosphohydrolase, partial [Treponema sp.]|nr:metal-dependent phosphohydrolase [Treponema sp.]